MKKSNLLIFTFAFMMVGSVTLLSCKKDTPPPADPVVAPATSKSLSEDFDNVGDLGRSGWVLVNNSEPIGGRGWGQGKYTFGGKYGGDVIGFPAFSANNLPTDYAGVDLTAVNELGGISAWMITPVLEMKNGDKISFYTRSGGAVADRMQVRANFNDNSANVGGGVEGVGKFTTLLLDIDPTLALVYPTTWTNYTITLSGITGTVKGRIAFRYYIPSNAGNSGANADVIGVDSFHFESL